MNSLFFVRHAETDLAGKFCGHLDPVLNSTGHKQTDRVSAELSALPIDFVYTSDLQRASQTAEQIASRCKTGIEARRSLREIAFGYWEGLTWEEVEQRYPDEAKCWVEEFPHSSAPGGERYIDFESRVLREMNFLLEQANARRVVVVTHAGFIRVMLTTMYGFSAQEAWEKTGSYGSIVQISHDELRLNHGGERLSADIGATTGRSSFHRQSA